MVFGKCHIINTEHDGPDNLVARYVRRCFVARRILDEGQRVGYLCCEEPDDEDDSGWRITANGESEAHMDDASNLAYVSLDAVLSRDDSFRELLDAAIGSAFVRAPGTNEFIAADAD